MRVLVTGSEGFVGRHVVAALDAHGDTVMGIDRKTGWDLVDPINRYGTWLKPDAIIHLAGACSTSASITDPLATFQDTVVTTVNVLDAFRDVPAIVTSSVKARDARTPYGAAKRMVETWALEHGRTHRRPVIVNRPGTIYGPGQEGSPESGWIAWFLRAKAEGRTVTVYGDGNQVRDLLHVEDYVRLLLTQLRHPEPYVDDVWDVGGGLDNAVSVEEMVEHLGLRHVHGSPRYGDERAYIGVNDVPGWEPVISWRGRLA